MRRFITSICFACIILTLFSCSKQKEKTIEKTIEEVAVTKTVEKEDEENIPSSMKEKSTSNKKTSSTTKEKQAKDEETTSAIEDIEVNENDLASSQLFYEEESKLDKKSQNVNESNDDFILDILDSDTAQEEDKTDTPTEEEVIVEEREPIIVKQATNLKASYNGSKNLVTLTFTDPTDEGYSYLRISENGKDMGLKVKSGRSSVSFKPLSLSKNTYKLTSYSIYDDKGETSNSATVDAYMFTSIDIPQTRTKGTGSILTITVKGTNFLHSYAKSAIQVKYPLILECSEIKIIDNETLTFDYKVPDKVGDFKLKVECGDDSIIGDIKITPSPELLTIVRDRNIPVGIIVGYTKAGVGIGMGLRQGSNLQWALENSKGFTTMFKENISIPSVVGAHSAKKAIFTKDIDGYDNWSNITKRDKKCLNSDGSINDSYVKENYPLFYSALHYKDFPLVPEKYKTGWYVPTVKEMCEIYKNKDALNEILARYNGDLINNDFYWTSSQNDEKASSAIAVRFQNGAIFKYYDKSNAIYSRYLREFPNL